MSGEKRKTTRYGVRKLREVLLSAISHEPIRGCAMPQWTFKINNEHKTVDAFDVDDALEQAGIDENDDYELIEGDEFKNKLFMSAITDEILFGE